MKEDMRFQPRFIWWFDFLVSVIHALKLCAGLVGKRWSRPCGNIPDNFERSVVWYSFCGKGVCLLDLSALGLLENILTHASCCIAPVFVLSCIKVSIVSTHVWSAVIVRMPNSEFPAAKWDERAGRESNQIMKHEFLFRNLQMRHEGKNSNLLGISCALPLQREVPCQVVGCWPKNETHEKKRPKEMMSLHTFQLLLGHQHSHKWLFWLQEIGTPQWIARTHWGTRLEFNAVASISGPDGFEPDSEHTWNSMSKNRCSAKLTQLAHFEGGVSAIPLKTSSKRSLHFSRIDKPKKNRKHTFNVKRNVSVRLKIVKICEKYV